MTVYENKNHDVVVTESELKGDWKPVTKAEAPAEAESH